MGKRTIIIGVGVFGLLGALCLGGASVAGIAGVFLAKRSTAESVIYEVPPGLELMPSFDGMPEAMVEDMIIEAEPDTELDTEMDTEADTEAAVDVAAPRPTTRRTSPRPAPIRRSASPEPAPRVLDEEEDLDDMDLERTTIEIIDDEIEETPRERRRRLRRGD